MTTLALILAFIERNPKWTFAVFLTTCGMVWSGVGLIKDRK